MSKFEITNTQYEQFIKETGHQPPGNWENGRYLNGEENFPVTTVTFDDAVAYAKWLSQKDGVEYSLPTEKQWEYAARNGSDGNLFPWGDKWEGGRAVMNGFRAKPVGSAPSGVNKLGVHDLIGNVWEWTNTTLEAYPGREMETGGKEPGKVIRGGSYFEKSDRKPDPVNSVFRNMSAESARSNLIGIRLVIN